MNINPRGAYSSSGIAINKKADLYNFYHLESNSFRRYILNFYRKLDRIEGL